MKTCAMFIDADPLSSKEIHAMQTVGEIYGHVDVFLERKASTKKSLLSYSEKVATMRHDLAGEAFSWDVHPVDVSKHDALKKAGISSIAMIASAGSDSAKLYEQAAMHFQLLDHCQVVFIPVKQREDVSPKFIWQLVLDGASEAICSKYVSCYAWLMAKLKLVKKLFVECPAESVEAAAKVFRDREDEWELLRLEPDLETSEVEARLAKAIEKTSKKRVALVSTSFSPEAASLADVCLRHGQRGSLAFGGATPEATARSLV